jgi:rhodanese-related sulfurtransferase/DNA-binding transcriptional ArsR family regulator
MSHRDFKTLINEQFARIAKALANPHRIEIVDVLAQGERSVEAIAQETALSVANASQHLQALREAQVVKTRKVGLHVFYRLSNPNVYRLIQVLRELAQQELAEVDRIVDTYLSQRSLLEPISLQEMQQRLDDPNLVILDVRPALEYQQGHIAGARSIPIDELQSRLAELPKEQEIVAYCRGAYCVFADEAVAVLKAAGYQVYRMQEGYPDWELENLPIERAEN